MIPPPSHRTIDRCLALIPDGWTWGMFSPCEQRDHFTCRISAPEWDSMCYPHDVDGRTVFKEKDQPHANFWGRGDTALNAVVDALELMEANR